MDLDDEHDSDVFVSVIIPSYNAADILQQVLEKITKVLTSIPLQYELIVINDGSKDSTSKILQELERKQSNLKSISYEQNRGKGYALKAGIKQSHGKYVILIDSDLDISSEVIPMYIDQITKYDLLIGSKLHPDSKIRSPSSRRILSKLFGIMVRLLTGLEINDTQVGLKIGDGNLLRMIFSIMTIDRFSFDVELLVIASILNMRVKDMPVVMNIKKGFKFGYSVRMLWDLLVISYKYRIKHEYQKKLQLLNLTPTEHHRANF